MKRSQTITQKVTTEATGLNAAFYCHVDHDPLTGLVHSMRISTPGKFDNSQLEALLRVVETHINLALGSANAISAELRSKMEVA